MEAVSHNRVAGGKHFKTRCLFYNKFEPFHPRPYPPPSQQSKLLATKAPPGDPGSREGVRDAGTFFGFFFTSLLEYNCFKMLCLFLLYNKQSELAIGIHISPYPLPLASPSLPPSLSHPSRWSQSTELISLCYAAASH